MCFISASFQNNISYFHLVKLYRQTPPPPPPKVKTHNKITNKPLTKIKWKGKKSKLIQNIKNYCIYNYPAN